MLTKPDTEHSNGKRRPAQSENAPSTNSEGAEHSPPVKPDALNRATAAIDWHDSAPAKIREAYALGSQAKGWGLWAKYLGKRDLPSPQKLLPAGRQSLAWGLAERNDLAAVDQINQSIADIARLHKTDSESAREAIAAWLDKLGAQQVDLATALQAVAWAQSLPRLATVVEESQWTRLLAELLRLADDGRNAQANDPLLHQLIAGELPLTLAYQLPEIESCRQRGASAVAALADCIAEILDGEGLPNCRHLDCLRGLLACWTRCRAVGVARPDLGWDEQIQTQYCWVVRNALRLTRRDGGQMLSRKNAASTSVKLFTAACALTNDRQADQLFAVLFGRHDGGKRKSKAASAKIAPAAESEWSELAILRSDWTRSSPTLAVAYGEQSVRCELAVGSSVLTSGHWKLNLSVNGTNCPQVSAWEQVCWVTDEDVDYLELEAHFADNVRVQRQILLGRNDHFLLLADALIEAPATARLEYTSHIALADGVRFEAADETREGWLSTCKPAALVMPLALPEWRADPRGGSLTTTDNSLELRQSGTGKCMFAPLFFGLDRKWRGKQLTWRQLTVAETRETKSAEVAVGYRVQIGKLQWLIYRSLACQGTRTVLGQNVASEFLVGRFHKTKPFKTYVDIEY